MKLFNNKQLQFRIVAAIADAVLFYSGFLFINALLNGSRISVLFFILTALCGLFVNFIPYNDTDKRRQTLVFGSIGLTLSIGIIAASSLHGYSLLALPIAFIALVFLYYRTYVNYLANVLYVYTVGDFYQRAVLLFGLNAACVLFVRSFNMISEELVRYSILYIVMAVYLLSEVKNFRYVSKNENAKRTAFDIAATGFMLLITVVMSIPGVFKTIAAPFVVTFQFIYGWIAKGIIAITYPFAWLMNYIFSFIEQPDIEGKPKPIFEGLLGISDKYDLSSNNMGSPLLELIGKALTFVLMLAICAYAVYLLFRFIDKVTRSEDEIDFEEDKEFILRSSKEKTPGLLNKLTGTIKKAAGNLAFMLTADNKAKLRSEYKGFIQRLHSKELIGDYNCTAQEIQALLKVRLPEQHTALNSITDLYEEVRYGVRYPEDHELKSFKKNIAEISKKLQEIQPR